MLYTLPPSPPAIVSVEPVSAPGDEQMASECRRGSRDCFPKDRIGYQAGETWLMPLALLFTTSTQDA